MTRFGCFACHCWTNGEVGRATYYLGMNQLSAIAQIRIDAGVNNPNFDSSGTAQHIDCGTASQKVVNHLRRDFAGIGTNALDRYPMIPSDDIDSLLSDDGGGGPLNRGQSISDLFKASKAARWFCECQLPFASCIQPRLVDGFNLPTYLVDKQRWVVHGLMS